jgi:hypothetical protein
MSPPRPSTARKPQRLIANRRNAQASTGPRSRRGKRRVRRNALKHGLAAGTLAKGVPRQKIDALVAALVGLEADPSQRDAAATFAVAHLQWLRVQAVSRRTLKNKLRALKGDRDEQAIVAQSLLTSDQELLALARYERRAAHARLRAARALGYLAALCNRE